MLIIINFSKKEQIIKLPIEYKNALLIYALKKSSNERSKIAGLNAIILKKK
jgi:hypothetical protein